MFRKPAGLYVLIAAAALSAGLLVYLCGRQPEHVYFLFHGFSLATGHASPFGVLGNYLPSLVHVYAFILLTTAVAGSSNARLLGVCGAWFVMACLFEFGQHPAISPVIAAALPAWFTHVPVLDNTAAYFLKGTFDRLDLLSIAAGTVAAGLTVVWIRNRISTRPSENPPQKVLRIFAISGLLSMGMLTIIGSGGGDGTLTPGGATATSNLYVSGNGNDTLLSYNNANSVSGTTPASRTVSGVLTTLNGPRGIAVDMARNQIYVANYTANSILVFNNARSVTGNVAPIRTITGGSLNGPTALFIDVVNNRLYVTNNSDNSVLVYDSASSATTPARTLMGGMTTLNAPTGVYVDITRNLLYVANGSNQILVFNNAAITSGTINIAPLRSISISSSSAGVFVDVMADRLYVANTGANSIFIFDSASRADGAATHRVISASLNGPRDVFVDTGTDRLYVANAVDDSILVFNNASTTNNPVAPTRALSLPTFTYPWGVYVDVTPIVIGSTQDMDGFITFDGATYTATVNGGAPRTGDDESFLAGSIARQFFSFDLSNIPTDVSVNAATLRLYQMAPTVGAPFSVLGSVLADHVDYGAALDASDGDFDNLLGLIGTLSTNDSPGYRTLNVAAQVKSDLAGGLGHSQYRLRFSPVEINNNSSSDYVQYTDAEDSCCSVNWPPQLAVTIQP